MGGIAHRFGKGGSEEDFRWKILQGKQPGNPNRQEHSPASSKGEAKEAHTDGAKTENHARARIDGKGRDIDGGRHITRNRCVRLHVFITPIFDCAYCRRRKQPCDGA